MAIKIENVGIAVRDLEATISFFTDLGLTVALAIIDALPAAFMKLEKVPAPNLQAPAFNRRSGRRRWCSLCTDI